MKLLSRLVSVNVYSENRIIVSQIRSYHYTKVLILVLEYGNSIQAINIIATGQIVNGTLLIYLLVKTVRSL